MLLGCSFYAQTAKGHTDFPHFGRWQQIKMPGPRTARISDSRQCPNNRREPGREAAAIRQFISPSMRERIEGMALDHHNYDQSRHPVQERKSFQENTPAVRLDST
jgi:hypothetical protein